MCFPSCVTVGTFDGVHSGHKAVIETLAEVSRERNLKPVAVTFSCHPLSIIAPSRAPGRIMDIEDEVRILAGYGIDVVVLDFDREMMRTTAREWMSRLISEYNVKAFVMGYDNTFGSDGVDMSLADYQEIGRSLGVDVISAPIVHGVSSSAIRRAIASGDIGLTNKMLGRKFYLKGKVVRGDAIGRTIGFPTANISLHENSVIPAFGVYAAGVSAGDGSKPLAAVVNVGVRPTVTTSGEIRIEVHILDWTGDIYGHSLKVEFAGRIRGEKRFNSLDELENAISADIASARALLRESC